LTTESTPKAIHDYKAAIHALDPLGIHLQGVQHDPMLYSYLLDPTYSSHRLADVALRRFNLKLSQLQTGDLAEAADVTGRLASALREEVKQAGLTEALREIDLPLVPVLARMERAGVKIDTAALAKMSSELEREIGVKAKEIYEAAGMEFNIGSPKQLGDVLFNKMNLAKPVKYGKGRVISTAVDVLETLAEDHPIARMVLDYRQLTKLKSTYVDTLPALINPPPDACTPLSAKPELPPAASRPPIRICKTFPSAPSSDAAFAPPSSPSPATSCSPPTIRRSNFACSRTSRAIRCWSKPTAAATTSTPSPPRKSLACRRSWSRRASPRRQSRQLRHRLRPLALRPLAKSRHRARRSQTIHRQLFREIQRRPRLHRQNSRRSPPRPESKNPPRTHPPHPRHQQQERQPARLRRTHRRQHPAARHRRRLIKVAMIRIDAALQERN
jgi:hypothetical protein